MGLRDQRMVASIFQGELKSSFELEALKGCDPMLYSEPVCIEPQFDEYKLSDFLREEGLSPVSGVSEGHEDAQKVFLRLWFSVNDEWENFELFLREISINKKDSISFLIVGNKDRVTCEIGVCSQEEVLIRNAITPRLPNIQMDISDTSCFSDFCQKSKGSFELRDFVPMPPYWNSLNCSSQGKVEDSLLPVFSALSGLGKDECGFFQVVLKPARNEWRDNLLNLIQGDFETSRHGTLYTNIYGNSGFVPNDYKETLSKLNGPFLSVSIRAGCKAKEFRGVLDSLSLPVLRFMYGNKEFSYLTKNEYLKILSTDAIVDMIGSGRVHRCGMLLTSTELSSMFCPFPSKQVLDRADYALDKTKGFKANQQFLSEDGVVLGINEYAGKKLVVKQKESIRAQHTSIFGLIGVGKSCLEEAMFLCDVNAGRGVGMIDIHGDNIERILRQIPKERIGDVVLFDPTDEKYTACYNPFELFEGEDIGKRVDDLVSSVKVLFSARDWGHVIESVLYPLFYTLLIGKDLALSDARILLSKTEEGNVLRESLIPQIVNEDVGMFWVDSFERMPFSTIQRVINKLSNFLLRENVRRIFSNKINKINFREIIDKKKIFLGYLPSGKLGDSARILGASLISAFYHASMSRQNIAPSGRVPFTLYIDETARLGFRHLEDALRELRKYNTRLVLSFQKKTGLSEDLKQALGNVGTIIVLDTDFEDASNFFKVFYCEVEANDFMRKGRGKAFVKMENNITNITTIRVEDIKGDGHIKNIKKLTREKYCTPIETKKGVVQILSKRKRQEVYDEI